MQTGDVFLRNCKRFGQFDNRIANGTVARGGSMKLWSLISILMFSFGIYAHAESPVAPPAIKCHEKNNKGNIVVVQGYPGSSFVLISDKNTKESFKVSYQKLTMSMLPEELGEKSWTSLSQQSLTFDTEGRVTMSFDLYIGVAKKENKVIPAMISVKLGSTVYNKIPLVCDHTPSSISSHLQILDF